MLINGMVTVWLSESLVHLKLGVGLPLRGQFSVTFSPSLTMFPVISEMLGGTAIANVQA